MKKIRFILAAMIACAVCIFASTAMAQTYRATSYPQAAHNAAPYGRYYAPRPYAPYAARPLNTQRYQPHYQHQNYVPARPQVQAWQPPQAYRPPQQAYAAPQRPAQAWQPPQAYSRPQQNYAAKRPMPPQPILQPVQQPSPQSDEKQFPWANQTLSGMGDGPVYFEADDVRYDNNAGTVLASGNIQVIQSGRILRAQKLRYDRQRNILSAQGNVVLQSETGEVVYADSVEIRDRLKSALVENLRLRLSDGSRLAARSAQRQEGDKKVMDHAVFSACAPCEKNPNAAPLWQVKAKKVVHDEKAQEIQYEGARMEFYGVPVMYMPYLSHPDPDLKRKSGLLPPSISNSDDLGLTYRQPYYWAIQPHRDLVVEPILMRGDGAILNGRYRERFQQGFADLRGSVGHVDRRVIDSSDDKTQRGHIDARVNLDLNDNWRAGLAVNRASDKTYLRRYKFSGDEVLVSKAFGEGFYGRDYAQLRALSFQGLRNFDKDRTTPFILPQMGYSFVSDNTHEDGSWQIYGEMMNLQRIEGTDSRRAALDVSWQKSGVIGNGHLLNLQLRNHAAGYYINDYDNPDTAGFDPDGGWRGRTLPQANLNWRYPLSGKMALDNGQILTKYVEPIVSIVAAPNTGRNNDIPNEDSQAFEFDESNLFNLKRFPGYDRFAGGQRVDYGLHLGLFDEQSRGGSLFVGQSWRLREDATYAPGSGLEKHFSDTVGKIEINPSPMLDLIYRFRIDTDKPALRRSEFSAQTHTGPVKLGLDYMFLDRFAGNGEFNDREQVGVRSSWQMTDHWNLSGRLISDINSSHATRLWALGVTYSDECISTGLSLERDFINDLENTPSTSIVFRIDLKHLGGELQKDYFTPKRGDAYTGTLLP